MTKEDAINVIKNLTAEDQKEVVQVISNSLKENEDRIKKEALKKTLSEMVDNGTLQYRDYSYGPSLKHYKIFDPTLFCFKF